MPSLSISQLGDLLTTTLSHFEVPDYTSLVTDLQDHPAAKQLIKRSSMTIQSGKDCVFKVRMNTGNSFANISITDVDSVNIVDGFVTATVNWRKSKVDYAFYAEELTINRSPARLVDLIKAREQGALVDWIEGLENNFWRFPAATDTLTPFGVPYWVFKNSSEGLNGGIPTGYSDVAGISPTTYSRWKNYTAQYTAVTLDDFVRKARLMAENTNFQSPVSAIPDKGKVGKRGYYTTISVIQTLEDVADSRNDNLGPDVAKMDGTVLFRRMPVERVPRLEEDTTNPMYQIDWGVFKVILLDGWWQKRTVLAPFPGRRNVTGVFLDSIYQTVCFNRRNLGVIATGTSYP